MWINEIDERSNTRDHVIMVMANKCDLLADMSTVVELENELETLYPNVLYHETSVLFNLEVQISMANLADKLESHKYSYVQ